MQREQVGDRSRKHGMSMTPTYCTWRNMIARCINSKRKDFKKYGGRGIKVCGRWLNSLKNFLEDMGEKPEGLTIERFNNNGDYEPNNCKWATLGEQSRNKRVNSRQYWFYGRGPTGEMVIDNNQSRFLQEL